MTLVLSSTGHAGMECVMTNLLEKGDVVLIANHGIWGERAMDMARRQGKFVCCDLTSFFSLTESKDGFVVHYYQCHSLVIGEVQRIFFLTQPSEFRLKGFSVSSTLFW